MSINGMVKHIQIGCTVLLRFSRRNLLHRHIVPDIRPENPVQVRLYLPRLNHSFYC